MIFQRPNFLFNFTLNSKENLKLFLDLLTVHLCIDEHGILVL